jgi:tRNA-dihydrouridine synthase
MSNITDPQRQDRELSEPLRLILAPIRGVTDAAFREAFMECFGGFDAALAPFLAPARGRMPRPKDIAEVSPGENRALSTTPQILADDPELFLTVAKMLADVGCQSVNWNLGCPQPMVTRRGCGAGMLPHPDRIAAFLEVVVPRVGIAVSVKVRLGMHDASESGPVMQVLNSFPLQEVIIHTRTGDQMYKQRADPSAFERILPACRHPLVYNGDIVDPAGFAALARRFPNVTGWMIGRGALSDPFLPAAIKGQSLGTADRIDRLRTFHDRMLEHYLAVLHGPAHVLDKMEGLWGYWTTTVAGKKKLIKRIQKIRQLDRYRKCAEEIFGAASPTPAS